MKVNIRGVWYDAQTEPIHLKLDVIDKSNIQMMEDKENIIRYPNNMSLEEAKKILKIKK
jgi:hypothetical protein